MNKSQTLESESPESYGLLLSLWGTSLAVQWLDFALSLPRAQVQSCLRGLNKWDVQWSRKRERENTPSPWSQCFPL